MYTRNPQLATDLVPLLQRHLRQRIDAQGVVALGQGDVVPRAERRVAQPMKGGASHATARQKPQLPPGANGRRLLCRRSVSQPVKAAVEPKGRAAGLAGALTPEEEGGLMRRVEPGPVVTLSGAQHARVAVRAHRLAEARLRVLPVHDRGCELVGGSVARGDEEPPGIQQRAEHPAEDGGVGHVHHLHLVVAQHAHTYRPPRVVQQHRRQRCLPPTRHVRRAADCLAHHPTGLRWFPRSLASTSCPGRMRTHGGRHDADPSRHDVGRDASHRTGQ
eukprot:scaffold3356_cov112-Isochrysis_galbana.AAC.10